MKKIDTSFLERCFTTLEQALSFLFDPNPQQIEYDMHRSASIKEFDIILELSGKLLRKVLKPYFHSSMEVDKLVFKDVFRQAVLRDIISVVECERLLEYRDTKNSTSPNYGVGFSESIRESNIPFVIEIRDWLPYQKVFTET